MTPKYVEAMKQLATEKHRGQSRKDGKTPYIEHPAAVAHLLESWGVRDGVTLSIAWGHDILEECGNTPANRDAILAAGGKHGQAILSGILMLTYDKALFANKELYLLHIERMGDPNARLVKSADRLCNTRGFLALGRPEKAERYLKTGKGILESVEDNALRGKIVRETAAVEDEIRAAKKKGPASGITEICFILDRSGSMSDLAQSTIDGYNEFLEGHRQGEGTVRVSTVLFDDRYEVLHSHRDVRDVRPITNREYFVRGCTALLDAMGRAIQHMVGMQRRAPAAEQAEHVVFVVITDGYENASREFTGRQIKQMVEKETKEYGWEFVFLGANIDAFATAGALGFQTSHTSNYVADDEGTRLNYRAISHAVHKMRACHGAAPMAFKDGLWKSDIEEKLRRARATRSSATASSL